MGRNRGLTYLNESGLNPATKQEESCPLALPAMKHAIKSAIS